MHLCYPPFCLLYEFRPLPDLIQYLLDHPVLVLALCECTHDLLNLVDTQDGATPRYPMFLHLRLNDTTKLSLVTDAYYT